MTHAFLLGTLSYGQRSRIRPSIPKMTGLSYHHCCENDSLAPAPTISLACSAEWMGWVLAMVSLAFAAWGSRILDHEQIPIRFAGCACYRSSWARGFGVSPRHSTSAR